jgi:hypothetical protein
MYLKEKGWEGRGWMNLAQNRDTWWGLFECSNEAVGVIKCREFCDWLRNCYSLHGAG